MATAAKSELRKIDLLTLAGASSLAVATTGVAYTHAFQPRRSSAMSLELQFTSSGSVDVKIEMEHGGSAPATEGSADLNFVEADSVDPVSNGIIDELVHFIAISPVVAPFIRFKLTGQNANDATTTLTRAILRIADNA